MTSVLAMNEVKSRTTRLNSQDSEDVFPNSALAEHGGRASFSSNSSGQDILFGDEPNDINDLSGELFAAFGRCSPGGSPEGRGRADSLTTALLHFGRGRANTMDSLILITPSSNDDNFDLLPAEDLNFPGSEPFGDANLVCENESTIEDSWQIPPRVLARRKYLDALRFGGKTPRTNILRWDRKPSKAATKTGEKLKVYFKFDGADKAMQRQQTGIENAKKKLNLTKSEFKPKGAYSKSGKSRKGHGALKSESSNTSVLNNVSLKSKKSESDASTNHSKGQKNSRERKTLAIGKSKNSSKNLSKFSFFSNTSKMLNLDPNVKLIGSYTLEQRRERLQRFLEKRKARVWVKKVKYGCRKKLADSRPRVKGRFVPRAVQNEVLAKQLKAKVTNAEVNNSIHDEQKNLLKSGERLLQGNRVEQAETPKGSSTSSSVKLGISPIASTIKSEVVKSNSKEYEAA